MSADPREPGSTLSPEELRAALEQPLHDEERLIESLISVLPTGEITAGFEALHAAAEREARGSHLALAYARALRGPAVQNAPPPIASEVHLWAARFAVNQRDGHATALRNVERALTLHTNWERALEIVEPALLDAHDAATLTKFYDAIMSRITEPREIERVALRAVEAFDVL